MSLAALDIDQDFEITTIRHFQEQNPDYNKKYRVKRLKFALKPSQRNELLAIAAGTNRKHFLMIKMQMEGGFRIGEVVNLSVQQLNLDHSGGYVLIEQRDGDRYVDAWNPKTASGNRIVPLTREMANLLLQHLGKRKVGYVFESNKGRRKVGNVPVGRPVDETSAIRFINKYARACRSIGHNIGSHALRRTFASYLMNDPDRRRGEEKINIGEISRLLGHKDIKTTLLYLFEITDLTSHDKVRRVIGRMNN